MQASFNRAIALAGYQVIPRQTTIFIKLHLPFSVAALYRLCAENPRVLLWRPYCIHKLPLVTWAYAVVCEDEQAGPHNDWCLEA